MFGRTKKLEMLAWVAEGRRPLLENGSVEDMQEAARVIRSAWSDAGYPEGDAIELARALDRRVEAIKRKPFAERVRVCPWCSGRLFRISDERSIEGVPGPVRLVACEGCGATTMFWVRLGTLSSWPLAAVDDGTRGPFR